MSQEPATPNDPELSACRRFAALLSSHGKAEREVLAANVQVVRYGYGLERDEVQETFNGAAAVIAWAERSPEGISFQATRNGDAAIQYTLRVAGFTGAGTWLARTTPGGQLAHLEHRPRDLDESLQTNDEWREAVRASYEMRDNPSDPSR